MKTLKITILLLLAFSFFQSQILGQEVSKVFFNSARDGQIDAVKDYLDTGIDINSKDKKGNTILMYASESDNKQLVSLILGKGADMNILNNKGEDALSIAKRKKRNKIIDILSYEIANKSNTQNDYENYIKKFPYGDYTSIAKEKVEDFEYLKANKKNTIESYSFFINKFPNSKYKDGVKSHIDTLFYKQARRENNIKKFSEYLKEFPNGSFSLDARNIIDSLVYESACLENSLNSFSRYLDEFPKGIFSVNAKSKKDSLLNLLNILTEEEVKLLVKEISDILNPFPYLELYNDCANKSDIDVDSYLQNGMQFQYTIREGVYSGGGDYKEEKVRGSNGLNYGISSTGGYLEFYMLLDGKDLVIKSRYYDEQKKLSTYTITNVGELINVYHIRVPLSVDDFISDLSGQNAKPKLPKIEKVRILELSKPDVTYTEGNINFTNVNFYDQNGVIEKSYYATDGKVYKNYNK